MNKNLQFLQFFLYEVYLALIWLFEIDFCQILILLLEYHTPQISRLFVLLGSPDLLVVSYLCLNKKNEVGIIKVSPHGIPRMRFWGEGWFGA